MQDPTANKNLNRRRFLHLSGLTAGQTVVTKAGSFVRDGERINPIAEASSN